MLIIVSFRHHCWRHWWRGSRCLHSQQASLLSPCDCCQGSWLRAQSQVYPPQFDHLQWRNILYWRPVGHQDHVFYRWDAWLNQFNVYHQGHTKVGVERRRVRKSKSSPAVSKTALSCLTHSYLTLTVLNSWNVSQSFLGMSISRSEAH